MSQTDLIARLEAEAARLDGLYAANMEASEWSKAQRQNSMSRSWAVSANDYRQRAADLRAAAAAVRLVVECREALAEAACYIDMYETEYVAAYGPMCGADAEELISDKQRATDTLASIADWEGKHGQ